MLSFHATVVSGDGIGKTLGFPTLNLKKTEQYMEEGVFFACLFFKNFCSFGVLHAGQRPTLQNHEFRIEIHLFKTPPCIEKNEHVHVMVFEKIRTVQKFENLHTLKTQIGKDVESGKGKIWRFPWKNKNFRNAYFFTYAFFLAKKGEQKVAPNPQVGCIILQKNKIIGKGFHEFFGGPHAEKNAIANAEKNGAKVEGSEMFVTLEPCCHENKKTPPCTTYLVEKKIAKVHVAVKDQNPEVEGKGMKFLENNGIFVDFADKKTPFYDVFFHGIQQKTSFFFLKLAQSADGFLGKKGERTQITGEKFRKKVQKWRDEYPAILVGANTILVDDCILAGEKTQPLRITFLRSWQKNFEQKKFFRDKNFLLLVPEGTEKEWEGKKILTVKMNPNGFPDFFDVKKKLFEHKIFSVFVEGGGKTAHELLSQNAVERIVIKKNSHLFLHEGVKGISDFFYTPFGK